ncbi:DUF3987 domain-containing protein [Salibacter halophilus]|uniref:DUF3987 domain-containing protein n=1 Tax=Salibacter halophilus TaxID=1803916 RepID=A0A6N6M6A4_9FLAO|nr:DUF3987 domain-containing protein [Salibacter halophilus]KAB1065137.1 DUF3987 domain-containing protein [Salibacter halophilus]
MATSTIFKHFTQKVEDKSLVLITKDIKGGVYEEQIHEIRKLLYSGDRENADLLKKKLPAFTPSGTFEGGRAADKLLRYSQFIILDLDKLSDQQLSEAFDKASSEPYTFCCFRSPSGQGLKILIEVDSEQEHHAEAFEQVATYYENALQLKLDRSGKDIPRLCFFSSDPECYRNLKHKKFHVELPGAEVEEPTIPPQPTPVNHHEQPEEVSTSFENCIQFTEQKMSYAEGNRNNFVYLLASNCNRAGIEEMEARELIGNRYDLSFKEIEAAVKSAYNHHSHEFAKFANASNGVNHARQQEEEDYLLQSPTIPDEVYQALPEILQEGASGFSDSRERDVFLTGALCILSGCLPNVTGIYAQRTVHPNLFSFIIAPAASGKGSLLSAKNLGDRIHEHMRTASEQRMKDYELELEDHKMEQKSRKKGEPATEPPEKPQYEVLYIPANTSNAKILWHLEENGGSGIICETEADTMGNIFKQEWGSYSDMLRKAFHHEKISCSRKTNNEYVEVKAPQLSVALSGTPSQVPNLINSAEDGLFSRFIFYAFKTQQIWRDVSPFGSQVNLTELFERLAKRVHDMHQFLQGSDTEVQLTREQWDQLNKTFGLWLKEVDRFISDEATSVVKRLGLICYRIAMIFTALRKFENGELTVKQECLDDDFQAALQLSNIYLKHSLLMFHNLPKQEDAEPFRGGDNKRKLFEMLPPTFKRAEAVELGKQLNLSARSVDYFLKKLQPDYVECPKTGHYQKVQ